MSDDTAPLRLPRGWYVERVAQGVDPAQPGIYEWHIEGVGVYIGKYGEAKRPRRADGRNVTNFLNDRPYRSNKPRRFRAVHIALAEAVRAGRVITLTFLENVSDEDARHQRERELIEARRQEAAKGGLPVLNSN